MNGPVTGNGSLRPSYLPGTALYTHTRTLQSPIQGASLGAFRLGDTGVAYGTTLGGVREKVGATLIQPLQHRGGDHFTSLAAQLMKRTKPATFYIPIPTVQRHPILQGIKQSLELLWEKIGGPNFAGETKGILHSLLIKIL